MLEKICEVLTNHRYSVPAAGGYRICKICGKVWNTTPTVPVATDLRIKEILKEEVEYEDQTG